MKNPPPTPVKSDVLGITRLEWDENKNPDIRSVAEIETCRDLKKRPEQLLCDVHEEALGNEDGFMAVVGTNKRLASMMLRVVKSNDRVTTCIIILAVVQVLLGILQVVLR